MEPLLNTSFVSYLTATGPIFKRSDGFCNNRRPYLIFPKACSSSTAGLRKSVIVGAKKKKEDTHGYTVKEDEATGPFPEAVLLKEKNVQEDGRLLPEFQDDEEQQLFEYLNLQLESDLNIERMRHYEVVYLIHEKHVEEVGSVNEKIQDFMREKKGKIWRLNDWGLRRLAYKIKKATHAHYILMNFELEAKWINDFKSLLDRDEHVIRHLVIKRDKAETEDCPPPPEFHMVRAGIDDNEDEDYDEEDDDVEVWDDEGDMDGDDNEEDGVIDVDDYDDEETRNTMSDDVSIMGRRNERTKELVR